MQLFNFWVSFLYEIRQLSASGGIFFPCLVVLTIGCLGLGGALIRTRRQLIHERRCTLDALEILAASRQEWFYFRPDSNRGVASEGLASYLGWNKPLERLEDFTKALQDKFSVDFAERVRHAKENTENFDVHIFHPDTGQGCEISAVWHMLSQTPAGLVFWLRDTTAFYQESEKQSQKLTNLAQENTQLKEMLKILPLPVWFRNAQGRLTYCNRFYAEALECSDEYITQENTLLWLDDQGEEDAVNTKETPNLTEPLKRHIIVHGERRYFQFKEEYVDNLGGAIGYGVDLTDLEKALRDLEQHNMAYREVLETLSAGVTIYGADKRLKFFNHAYARLFETDEKWLNTGPSLGEVLDDVQRRRLLSEQADYQSFKKQQLRMVSSLISPFQQLEHLPDERTIRRIAAPHPMGGIFFIFEDVTNSLALERQYNTQLAVHRASLDNLYEGVAVFGSDNQLKLINPAFIDIWGMSLKEVKLGQHISDVINMIRDFFTFEGSWEDYRAQLIARVTDRVPKKSRLDCKDDKVIDFTYVPLPDGSHLLTCMDVTDHCRNEKILSTRPGTRL